VYIVSGVASHQASRHYCCIAGLLVGLFLVTLIWARWCRSHETKQMIVRCMADLIWVNVYILYSISWCLPCYMRTVRSIQLRPHTRSMYKYTLTTSYTQPASQPASQHASRIASCTPVWHSCSPFIIHHSHHTCCLCGASRSASK
jgi:hypothetical protein